MSLPFELSAHATSKWLQSLIHLNSVNAANQLNKVIKELKTATSEANEILKILTTLTPAILFIISNIESSLLSKENPNVSNNPQKIEKLCIQLLRNLSLSFCAYTTNESLSSEEKNLALYLALQLIGYSQRSASVFHQFSSTTLWQIMGELYILADERNILSQEIEHKIKDFKQQTNIETVFKRNLLFTLVSPYQHSSNQIKEIFSISDQYAHLLDLNKDSLNDSIFFWDPENIIPPHTKNTLNKESNNILNIDTKALLSYIESDSFLSKLDKDTFEAISEKLSGFGVINNPLTSVLLINHLIIGFDDITEYLEKVEKLDKIEQLSSQLAADHLENKTQLESITFTNKLLDSSSLPPQSNSRNELLTNTKTVKILQSQKKQFLIAETYSINCSIGDITLLCSSNINNELGIIRQIRVTNQSGTIHILIERICGTVSFQQIESPKTPENKLISLQKEGSQTEVFLPPCKLSNGTQIKATSNKKFTLDTLIDYSPFFMYYHTL